MTRAALFPNSPFLLIPRTGRFINTVVAAREHERNRGNRARSSPGIGGDLHPSILSVHDVDLHRACGVDSVELTAGSTEYILNSSEDVQDFHLLLTNGSIFAPEHNPKILQPGIDYCIEIIPEMGINTFVCFSKDRTIITADSRITIYACGLLISVPFLILTIVAYYITPELKDVYGKAVCCYCGCLALTFVMLVIIQLRNIELSNQTCTNIGKMNLRSTTMRLNFPAFVIQFSFIACFFWLNAMCIEMWLLVRFYVGKCRNKGYCREICKRTESKTLFFWYSLWCWGPSMILILVSIIMDLNPVIPATYVKNSGKESCSFKTEDKAIPYFYVPIGLLLLGNVILFILTFIKLTKYQRQLDLRRLRRNEPSDQDDRRTLRDLMRTAFVCMLIFFLMGLNWMMELIFWYINGDSFNWSSFDLINALQGVLIFGLFVLRRPPRDFIWNRIQKFRGINEIPEREIGSMELGLLQMMNGDLVSR
ncbi:G-protein coupled receptor Mth2 [Apis cerana cerana]|uniref:G-protein coupled receptor Mth2 n=1 Tax=Apis cerana cerana TaxID=94128 RepID=A0A2A3E881_APICC|nr:G-protein coupled receptor Mth2 [Apis cerana cerana]